MGCAVHARAPITLTGGGKAQRALAAVGEWLRTHARLIRALQWVVVLVWALMRWRSAVAASRLPSAAHGMAGKP